MSVTLKGKWLLLAVFIFGCATGPVFQYLSFEDAVAKTMSKCQYTSTWLKEVGMTEDDEISVSVKYGSAGKMLVGNGWRIVSGAGVANLIWEKCKN